MRRSWRVGDATKPEEKHLPQPETPEENYPHKPGRLALGGPQPRRDNQLANMHTLADFFTHNIILIYFLYWTLDKRPLQESGLG